MKYETPSQLIFRHWHHLPIIVYYVRAKSLWIRVSFLHCFLIFNSNFLMHNLEIQERAAGELCSFVSQTPEVIFKKVSSE